jgi:hypothetical protein
MVRWMVCNIALYPFQATALTSLTEDGSEDGSEDDDEHDEDPEESENDAEGDD